MWNFISWRGINPNKPRLVLITGCPGTSFHCWTFMSEPLPICGFSNHSLSSHLFFGLYMIFIHFFQNGLALSLLRPKISGYLTRHVIIIKHFHLVPWTGLFYSIDKIHKESPPFPLPVIWICFKMLFSLNLQYISSFFFFGKFQFHFGDLTEYCRLGRQPLRSYQEL